MNKTEIVRAINSKVKGQTLQKINDILEAMVEIITAELKANNKVSFQGFLMIENRLIKGRSGEIAGNKWKTNDRLIPKAKLREKFKEEIKNGN